MKFKTHSDWELAVDTSLQGHIFNSYEGLKKIFGAPIISRDDKVECEWVKRSLQDVVAAAMPIKSSLALLGP